MPTRRRRPRRGASCTGLAENQLLRDLPVVPLWSGHGHAVWAPRVHDVTATPFTGLVLAGIGVS
ncbi:hypothetical protein [Amycolatopsis sp. lyj-346]|uniref:hypothetical protein n=1 Tax=Amycolatopsis sp. lyj-346 TaxID=2789289 RepID=UPI00397DE458